MWSMAPTDSNARPYVTPSLLSLGVAYVLLVTASVAALVFFRHDMALIAPSALNPFGPSEPSRLFFVANPEGIRASAFLGFASAISLTIYTATIIGLMECLGPRDAKSYVAFAGGLAASGGLAAAGLFLRVLSVPEAAASVPVARVLHFLVFLTGGPAFAAGMGLLAAGVSCSHFANVLPKWLVWLGLSIGATGVLSTFGLLSVPMTVAIPVTRVAGFVWLIAVGALAPKRERAAAMMAHMREEHLDEEEVGKEHEILRFFGDSQ